MAERTGHASSGAWTIVAGLIVVAMTVAVTERGSSRAAAGFSCRDELTPAVLFCDDFEDAEIQPGWDIGGHQGRWPVSDFVQCGEAGVGFHSHCAAWSNFLTFDHEWGYYGYDARHAFPPRPEFYVR